MTFDDVDDLLDDFELEGNTRLGVDELRYLAGYLFTHPPSELRDDD